MGLQQQELAVTAAGDGCSAGTAGHGDPGHPLVGIAGGLVLRVPAGSRVREGGFSLLGDRQTQVGAGDGPEIQVKVYGLVSDVKVTDQPG